MRLLRYDDMVNESANRPPFIQDIGPGVSWNGRPLPRYSVWEYGKKGKSKYEITKSGEELDPLMKEFGIDMDQVWVEKMGCPEGALPRRFVNHKGEIQK
jgi:hypothetical protein